MFDQLDGFFHSKKCKVNEPLGFSAGPCLAIIKESARVCGSLERGHLYIRRIDNPSLSRNVFEIMELMALAANFEAEMEVFTDKNDYVSAVDSLAEFIDNLRYVDCHES